MLRKLLKISNHKKAVWHESLWNTFVGFIVAYAFTVIAGPYIIGQAITHETSMVWTLAMTVVSVIRGYFLRLYFSRKRYIKELRKEVFYLKKKLKKVKSDGKSNLPKT